jgi:arylsulfatase A-like enzyme
VSVPDYLPQDAASHEEVAALQGAIRQADRAVGAIAESLERAGLSRNALFVFTADHGLAMPRAKCTLYDPGIEIALILHWPEGAVEGGRALRPMVSNLDVLPTLLEAAGVPAPPGLQGRSLLPLLRGEPYEERAAVFAEKTYHSYYDPIRAIRTEQFKYIRNFETAFEVEVPGDVQLGAIFRDHVELYHGRQHPPVELYDLTEDPLERHNQAGAGRLAEVQGRLDAALWSWMAETGDPLQRGPVPSPAYVDAQRRLRQYVETTSLTVFQTSP